MAMDICTNLILQLVNGKADTTVQAVTKFCEEKQLIIRGQLAGMVPMSWLGEKTVWPHN